MTVKRKKTTTLTLVLIASFSLTSCQTSPTSQTSEKRSREVYRNLEDCRKEWGGADKCEQVTDSSYGSGHYYGPYYMRSGGSIYYYPRRSSQPQLVPSDAGIRKNSSGQSTRSVGRVTRGGFGSTVRSGSRGS